MGKPMGSCYSCGYPIVADYDEKVSCPFCHSLNISQRIAALPPEAISGAFIAAGFLLVVALVTVKSSRVERRIY